MEVHRCLYWRMVLIKLFAPKEFWQLSLEERQGRCGAGEGFGERIVPDHILGLKVTPACSIHDYDFGVGETHEDFRKANRVFHINLYRLIRDAGGWLEYPRYTVATGYYIVVSSPIGAIAYWKGKNKEEEEGIE